MKQSKREPDDVKLSELLRASRPKGELPPGFQNAVWRSIENGEHPSVGMLEGLVRWFLTPRVATAGFAVVVLLAAGAGAFRGIRMGEREARDRYVMSVDPSYLQH